MRHAKSAIALAVAAACLSSACRALTVQDLGGETVTVGSDAHTPQSAAKGIREGYEVLRHCGFEYVTVFRQRKPERIKLD